MSKLIRKLLIVTAICACIIVSYTEWAKVGRNSTFVLNRPSGESGGVPSTGASLEIFENDNSDKSYRDNFKNGDLIFRRGLTLESRVISSIDGQNGFSHAGIIRKKGATINVIHASFAEEGQSEEVILREPIEAFLKPSSASSAEVFRYKVRGSKVPLNAAIEAEKFVDDGVQFDHEFNLNSAERIYCTELIWLAYRKANIDLTDGKFDRIPSILGDPQKAYILPSSLLNTGMFEVVWRSTQ